MLQTRDVECCVERGARRALMFGCCTPHGSQHDSQYGPEYFFDVVNV
jgi:hypothetical protein